MVSFNERVSITNYEGAKTFKANDFVDLYLTTATQMVLEPKFYGDKNKQFDEWITKVKSMAANYPDFVLKLASYTRNKLKLRTAPIIMLVETALQDPKKNRALVKEYAPKIIQRADEMAEIISYYIATRGQIGTATPGRNGLPNLLKTIINKELLGDKFTPYQLIKNDSNKSNVKLRDVLRITHPSPTDDNTREFFRKIVNKESVSEISDQTWEGYISKHGSRRETWEAILPKMPIFAILRNLRNFIEKDVSDTYITHHVISKLTSAEAIEKSRILPFRFYQAWKEIDKIAKGNNLQHKIILDALATAVRLSVKNIPDLDGTTVIAIDVSGSMSYSKISTKSDTHPIEIASLMGCLLFEKLGNEKAKMIIFDSVARQVEYQPDSNIMDTVKALSANGGATYAYLVPRLMMQNNIRADRVIMLTDAESYGRSLNEAMNEYRRVMNPQCRAYSINLCGYGHCDLNPANPLNIMLGGYSERVFDVINSVENQQVIVEISKE